MFSLSFTKPQQPNFQRNICQESWRSVEAQRHPESPRQHQQLQPGHEQFQPRSGGPQHASDQYGRREKREVLSVVAELVEEYHKLTGLYKVYVYTGEWGVNVSMYAIDINRPVWRSG